MSSYLVVVVKVVVSSLLGLENDGGGGGNAQDRHKDPELPTDFAIVTYIDLLLAWPVLLPKEEREASGEHV